MGRNAPNPPRARADTYRRKSSSGKSLISPRVWASMRPHSRSSSHRLLRSFPKKFNSVIWVRQGKDTLALGNITGAMVFQTCIPVAFGIAFTPWVLGSLELVSALLTFIAALTLYIQATREWLTARSLIFNGIFYFVFVAFVWILV